MIVQKTKCISKNTFINLFKESGIGQSITSSEAWTLFMLPPSAISATLPSLGSYYNSTSPASPFLTLSPLLTLLSGPHKESSTGRRMKPLQTPKMMIPNHILKNDLKMYDLEGDSIMIARNVEKAPWNTLEPMEPRAVLALKTRF